MARNCSQVSPVTRSRPDGVPGAQAAELPDLDRLAVEPDFHDHDPPSRYAELNLCIHSRRA
jgi:hypothetical protein